MKQITVATYNICHGHYAGCDWSRIASVIHKAGADLVGFQEIDMFTGRTGGLDTMTELIAVNIPLTSSYLTSTSPTEAPSRS